MQVPLRLLGGALTAMNQTTDVERVAAAVHATVHKHWALFLVEGLLLTVLGMLAILLPAVASLAATLIFGWILLLSGGMGLVTTLRARHAPGFCCTCRCCRHPW